MSFSVDQIDHVEFFVPDRYEAAAWYKRVLGLEILRDYEEWAREGGGPLMISSDSGRTKLALFEGEPQGAKPTAGYHLVAFRVDGPGFAEFLRRLSGQGLTDHTGKNVSAAAVVDHGKAYSIYFSDPYGHRLEVTTYDVERIKSLLDRLDVPKSG